MERDEYEKLYQIGKYQPKEITFKERMIEYLLRMRPDYKENKLRKLTSKQLFLISKSQGYG